ncbi:predicted protein [Chaetoceros tenuissimus]|uniref:Uncharacterized protein n=1 Tax=Chaetoceros tenuissimus TaxID=426638 RepID=A0AAD3DEW6_9STRA|nr:predicted protein [Chaetoceros tenuissimus]
MIIKSPSDVMIVLEDLSKVSNNTPNGPDLDMENLSYSEGIEDSKENNLSMYDSISDYRNVRSDTSHALPDEQDYTLEIKLPATYDSFSEYGEAVLSNEADHSSSDDKSSTFHGSSYVYYDMPKECPGD